MSGTLFATALHRAHAAEQAAAGTQRRPAYRLTRELIGAAVRAGVTREAIATILATTTSTVGNRISNHDGTLTSDQIHGLTGLTPHALALPTAVNAPSGVYATSSFVQAALERNNNGC